MNAHVTKGAPAMDHRGRYGVVTAMRIGTAPSSVYLLTTMATHQDSGPMPKPARAHSMRWVDVSPSVVRVEKRADPPARVQRTWRERLDRYSENAMVLSAPAVAVLVLVGILCSLVAAAIGGAS